MKKINLIPMFFLTLINISVYAKCEHTFPLKDSNGNQIISEGVKMLGCYASNYSDYSPLEVANQFLKEQILVKGGEFTLKYKPNIKVNMPSFYFGEYLVPYQQFNAYLRATNQWNYGIVKDVGGYNNARISMDLYNGLYPARASYAQAQGFCQWMGKITGLPIDLPAYGQWLYAATSEGKNWEYPTNNGKLEMGVNFPYPDENKLNSEVTKGPVNSIGIHQIFGNGYQYSSTVYNAENRKYFSVLTGQDGQVIMGGRFYSDSLDLVKRFKLDSVFAMTGTTTGDAQGVFRCVINTDKPIPKHLDKLKD